mgnify:FL=1
MKQYKEIVSLKRNVLFIFVNSISLAIYLVLASNSMRVFEIVPFLYGTLLSFLLWHWITLILGFVPSIYRFLIIFVLTGSASILALGSMNLLLELGEFSSAHMIKFLADDPEYITNYFQTYLLNWYSLFGLAATIGISWVIWYLSKNLKSTPTRKTLVWMILLPTLYYSAMSDLSVAGKNAVLPMDTSLAVSLYKFKSAKFKEAKLYKANRHELPEKELEENLNIVLIYHESIDRSEERRVGKEGRSRWSPYH